MLLRGLRQRLPQGIVVAVAVCAVAAGVQLVRFEVDVAAVKAVHDGGAPVEKLGFWRRPPDVKPVMGAWTSSFATASAARTLIVDDPDRPSNAAARLLDVTRALEVRPALARLWIIYADLLWQMGLPPERVWPAIEMAHLTGRRQAEVMLFSALQTVRLWETASQTQKERALSAIVGLRNLFRAERKEALKRGLAKKSPEVRREIASALADRLGKDRAWLNQVGL
jgi:hypothetical protein